MRKPTTQKASPRRKGKTARPALPSSPVSGRKQSRSSRDMLFEKPKLTLFLGFIALVLSGALWRLFSGGGDASSLDGDTHTQVILAVLYAGVLLLAFHEFRWTGWLMFRSPALV